MKISVYVFAVLMFTSFTFFACTGKQEKPLDLEQVRKAIGETNAKWTEAFNQGDAAAVYPFKHLVNDSRFQNVPKIIETPGGPKKDAENLGKLRGLISGHP